MEKELFYMEIQGKIQNNHPYLRDTKINRFMKRLIITFIHAKKDTKNICIKKLKLHQFLCYLFVLQCIQ